jgi:hypothetical protein
MTSGPTGGLIALLCVFAAAPLPALAHHSFAMFDINRTTKLSGVVEDFEMINPHGWVQLSALDDQGKARDWSLETAAPNTLKRSGWEPASLHAGDRITVTIHPLKDGTNGGELMSVNLPDGRTLWAGQPTFGVKP